jgi:hypothetical protein
MSSMDNVGNLTMRERYGMNYSLRVLDILIDALNDIEYNAPSGMIVAEMWRIIEKHYDMLDAIYHADGQIKLLQAADITVSDFLPTESEEEE